MSILYQVLRTLIVDLIVIFFFFFFFKQKTAYVMRISDWSSDVCSSDLNAVFPETVVQTCVVHLIRNSMSFASWKDRKLIGQSLRSVYRAATAAAGLAALEAFEEGHWGQKYPAIAQSWRCHWDQGITFFEFRWTITRLIQKKKKTGK